MRWTPSDATGKGAGGLGFPPASDGDRRRIAGGRGIPRRKLHSIRQTEINAAGMGRPDARCLRRDGCDRDVWTRPVACALPPPIRDAAGATGCPACSPRSAPDCSTRRVIGPDYADLAACHSSGRHGDPASSRHRLRMRRAGRPAWDVAARRDRGLWRGIPCSALGRIPVQPAQLIAIAPGRTPRSLWFRGKSTTCLG
jgi:hypothetical protein